MKRGRVGESLSAKVGNLRNPGGKIVGAAADGATVEVAKRPRGRPMGSKNNPKPPVVILRESGSLSALLPHVLEIPAGRDVADTLAAFSRGLGVGLGVCVLAASGAVSAATLRQPSPSSASLSFRGRFDLLSISATFLPAADAARGSGCGGGGGISISMAGPKGQILGGMVAGPVVAAGTVVVVVATFSNPTFHFLPEEDEASGSASLSGSGGGVGGEEKSERSRMEQQDEELRRPLQEIHMPTAAIEGAPVFGGGHFASGYIEDSGSGDLIN